MLRALSTHLLVGHRLTAVWLDRIYNLGVPQVEIFCARQHFDYRNRAQVTELAHWFKDAPLKLHSLHFPMWSDEVSGRTGPDAVVNIAEPIKWKRIAAVDEIKRALEVAELIPCRYLIQHLGYNESEYDERREEAAFSSLDELRLFAKGRGVDVLLENIPNAFSSAERLTAFLRLTHLDLGFCFDTGHANLTGDWQRQFELMKPLIRSTHVHDNNGELDQHLFPLVAEGGTLDWTACMEAFRACGDQFPLLLELKDPGTADNPLDQVPLVFGRLDP